MAKKIKNKPLRKYQQGGDPNNPFSFATSGLANPFTSDINYALGTLNVTNPNQQFLNFGDNPFGKQIGESATKTASMFSGMLPTSELPEWGDAESKRLRDQIAKEKGYVSDGEDRWKDPKTGDTFVKEDLDALAGQRYDAEKQARATNAKLLPLAAPMLMLNELSEAQKKSYNQAQKEGMYDVTKSPLTMENKGFFAREGMRTPPISQVYRMIGAHQGLPETNYRLLNLKAKKEYQQGGNVNFLDDILYGEDEVESFQNSGQVKKKLSIAERYNNPLNLVFSDFVEEYGAENTGVKQKYGNSTWSKFDDPRQAIIAGFNLFKKRYTNTPLNFAIPKFSGKDYDARVLSRIGFNGEEIIRDLSDDQLWQIVQHLVTKESPSHYYKQLKKEGILDQDYEEQQKKNQPLDIRVMDNTVPRVSTYVAPEVTASVPNFKLGGNINLRKFLFAEGGAPQAVRQLSPNEYSYFQQAKKTVADYVNSPEWENRFISMQIDPSVEKDPEKLEKAIKKYRRYLEDARSQVLTDLERTTPSVVRGSDISNQAGMFEPNSGSLYINEEFSNPNDITNVLLHELGHAGTTALEDYAAPYINRVRVDVGQSPSLPATEPQLTYTIGAEVPAVVHTLRSKAAEYGILPFGKNFSPQALNELTRRAYEPKENETQREVRDREFLKSQIEYLQSMLRGGEDTLLKTLNTIAAADKKQNNMYYAKNGGNMSLLSSVLRGSLIRGYQEGGMQQPMSEEEAMMMEQAMQEQAMREQAMQQQGMQQQQMQQPQPQQGGEMQQGENRYMQLPREKQVEAYKLIIDFIVDNGIDALEQQYPEEYQFFEEFSDTLEGEEMEQEGGEEGGEEMETEAGRMEMAGPEEEEMQSEYPTDEEEVALGARPGEGAMRGPMAPEQAQQMKQGGIPQRYRNMGFSAVGVKKKSTRPDRKWMVLAKKGNQYKVVHGGDPKMKDFTQHGSGKRKDAFWNRHGGKDSAKSNDKFSPMYYHKHGFKNAGPTW
jgi:hypothetical protein